MKKCKFYSEEIGKCLFDGPPDDCNEDNCTCFEPIKENKNIKKCKFYSDYICNHCGNGLCHYAEKIFGSSLPDSCNHIDDFENCTCFEPIECEKSHLFVYIAE